ncbi:hypothetical protein DS832_07050 [Bombilactobacillus bombi]|uniref:HTH cro/C1-type domain-containing protein n=2 Tax=Bombilactobacillus bombi TaxID=1303590 RepID=A0A3R6ZUW7_9LACO|nr:hypothetical protein DS832_07050 [Bombilactobacillus bombi]
MRSVKMFYGENIKLLRNLHGMSRRSLAVELNCSEQTIGQYERGVLNPKMKNIIDMSAYFAVKSSFFYSKLPVKDTIPEKNIAYRSRDRDVRKKTLEGSTKLKLASSIIEFCESSFNLKASPLLTAIDEVNSIKNKQENSDLSKNQIESYANITRNLLGIKSNSELLYNLELNGVYVIESDALSYADAYSVWSRNNDNRLIRPFIVLGNSTTLVRRIFDLAHELGHLVIHYDVDMNNLEKEEFLRCEKEANEFASAFLLPQNEVSSWIKMVIHKGDPDAYIPVKQKYYVSLATAAYRAYELGYLSKQENSRFFASRYRKHYVYKEPFDDKMPLTKPGKIMALFEIYNKKIEPFSNVLNDFSIEPQFLSDVFCLPEDLITKLVTKKPSYYNNIIEF